MDEVEDTLAQYGFRPWDDGIFAREFGGTKLVAEVMRKQDGPDSPIELRVAHGYDPLFRLYFEDLDDLVEHFGADVALRRIDRLRRRRA